MANLSEMTSTGESSWDRYVKNKSNFMTTEYYVENGIRNEPLYDTNFKKVLANLNSNERIYIKLNNYQVYQNTKYAKILYRNTVGFFRISAIQKPTKNINSTVRALEITSNTLESLKAISGIGRNFKYGIDIEIPGLGLYTKINKVEKTTNKIHGNQLKSDYVFKNTLGNPVLYISHKNVDGANGFKQYGGEFEFPEKSKNIYENSEVQSYLNRLYSLYMDSINDKPKIENNPFINGNLKKSVYKEIYNTELINLSIYGGEASQGKNQSNVDMLGQGSFIFTPLLNNYGDVYFRLSFSGHSSINGQTAEYKNKNSQYKAILLSIPNSGKTTNTPSGALKNIKTGIYPKKYKQNSISIDTLNF